MIEPIVDPAQPPNPALLCPNGHVACVQAWEPGTIGEVAAWCWGYHLIYRCDRWPEVVSSAEAVTDAIDRLVAMLVGHEVDHTRCTFLGRIG